VIRRTLAETPVFEREAAEGTVARLPLVVLFREHGSDVLRVVLAALVASLSTIFTVFALSYAVNTVDLDKTPMLWVGVLANVAALVTIPLWAVLSDRIGRRPVFVAGALGSAVTIFAYLWSISTGHYGLIFLFGILMFGVVYTATSGVWPSLYGEMFTPQVRLSGFSGALVYTTPSFGGLKLDIGAFDPAVLILDEATASVDPETESRLQQALETVLAGRTSIVIAHRLATIRNADRILVLHRGRLVEEGTHASLLAREEGLYRSLVQLQTQPAL
jgi:hypothetical protein